mgnify:CR=1 FL=1
MEIPASAKIDYKNKMADSRFAISNQSDFQQLKENYKNQNTSEVTQIKSLAELGDRTESEPEN